ncbi:hypothetical protein SAMN05421870_1221, partial [Streptomyces qinglanensis]
MLVDGVDDANDDSGAHEDGDAVGGSRAGGDAGRRPDAAGGPPGVDEADTLVLDPVTGSGRSGTGTGAAVAVHRAGRTGGEAGLRRQRRAALRHRAGSAAALVLLAAGCLLQVLGIAYPHAFLVVAGALLGLLTDVLLPYGAQQVVRELRRAQLTPPVRQLLRDALLLGGLGGLGVLHPAGAGALLPGAVLLCWVLHFSIQAVAAAVRDRRRLPVVTRNIDTSALRLSPAPPALFAQRATVRLTAVAALTTAGMSAAAVSGDPVWASVPAWGCCAGLLLGTAHLAGRLLPGRRVAGEEEALAWLDGWLAEYRPTTGMYFSGGTTSAYQANMWLSTLAELEGRPLIVLRERFMVQKIDATDVPIVCIPKVSHLMHLEHSTLKVLLHPANSGKTSQVLRIPTLKHAFINHGESDKLSSCNPYAKAYDQVWVAGEAARERYRLAEVGVDDKDVVEVGRPQLA